MGLFDETITYRYTCSDCNFTFDHSATFSDHSKISNLCEKCGGHLIFKAVDYNPHTTVDMDQPKTVGTLAEKNSKEREKRGESLENPNKRYNKEILKNPQKYIMTGKT